MSGVRIRSSEAAVGRGPGPVRRVVSALLYPFFSLVLVAPAVRRLRRRRGWQAARLVAVGGGLGLAAAGFWAGAAAVAAAAALLPPLEDPDRLRQVAERLGAPHVLNGGIFEHGDMQARPGCALLFFLSPQEMLVAAAGRPETVLARRRLGSVESIRVDGQDYRPQYVSFAKEPPRREEHPDREAVCRLEIRWTDSALEVSYRGAFARHLAETAAHSLWSLRKAGPALRVL